MFSRWFLAPGHFFIAQTDHYVYLLGRRRFRQSNNTPIEKLMKAYTVDNKLFFIGHAHCFRMGGFCGASSAHLLGSCNLIWGSWSRSVRYSACSSQLFGWTTQPIRIQHRFLSKVPIDFNRGDIWSASFTAESVTFFFAFPTVVDRSYTLCWCETEAKQYPYAMHSRHTLLIATRPSTTCLLTWSEYGWFSSDRNRNCRLLSIIGRFLFIYSRLLAPI